MNTNNPSEEQIFEEALRLSGPGERAAYLDKACADNEPLRKNVEALLRAHDQAGAFLQQPPAALSAKTFIVSTGTIPVSEKPGDKIGHYKLREKLGEGGCGVVYVAEQEEPVRRRVALKIIKLGMDTKQVVARFEAERQALALMDHPNIAKVLDAGATDTGRPYFVMELVRGIRITDYCDKNNLSTEERLKLFIQVCSAIQHAHQKGIIHRDIKPSNILVTLHDGVPEEFDVRGNRVFGWGPLYAPSNAPSSLLTWEANSGKLLGRTSWDSRYRFSFAPNNRIAVPKTNNVVELWDPVSGDTVATFPFGGSIIFSPDGRLLAITRRGMTKVFNLEIPDHILASATGYMVSFPDEEMILMLDEQGALVSWNIRSNTIVPFFTSDARLVCISALGNAALLEKKNSTIESNSIHTISFVDLVSGREQVLDSFSGAKGSPSITAGLAPDGKHAFTGFAYTEKQWAKNINVFQISLKGIERANVPTPTYLGQVLVDSAVTRMLTSSERPADFSALMPWDYIDSVGLDAFAKLNRLIDAHAPKPKSGVSVVKEGTMFVPADREATTGVIALAARNGLLVTGGDGFVKSWDKIGGPHEATHTSYLIGGLVRVYRIKAPVFESGVLGLVSDLAFSPMDDRFVLNYATAKVVRNQNLFSVENLDIPGLNIDTIRFLPNGILQKVIIRPGDRRNISVESSGQQPSIIHLDGPMLSYDTSPNGRYLAVIRASKLNGISVPGRAGQAESRAGEITLLRRHELRRSRRNPRHFRPYRQPLVGLLPRVAIPGNLRPAQTLTRIGACSHLAMANKPELHAGFGWCCTKAPEGWRSPRRFARFVSHRQTLRVMDCGGPPPLFLPKVERCSTTSPSRRRNSFCLCATADACRKANHSPSPRVGSLIRGRCSRSRRRLQCLCVPDLWTGISLREPTVQPAASPRRRVSPFQSPSSALRPRFR
jgi:serine/threonine protein kinase